MLNVTNINFFYTEVPCRPTQSVTDTKLMQLFIITDLLRLTDPRVTNGKHCRFPQNGILKKITDFKKKTLKSPRRSE